MKKLLIIILLVFIAQAAFGQKRYVVSCRTDVLLKSEEICLKQVGVREKTGNNDGPEIAKYLAAVNLRGRYPYCAAGPVWCYKQALKELGIPNWTLPFETTGLANGIYNSIKVYKVKTKYRAVRHDFLVWRARSGSTGHIERVIKVGRSGWVETVGFNTSNGKSGNQREGNGVFKRKRNIYFPLGRLVIRGLAGLENCNYPI